MLVCPSVGEKDTSSGAISTPVQSRNCQAPTVLLLNLRGKEDNAFLQYPTCSTPLHSEITSVLSGSFSVDWWRLDCKYFRFRSQMRDCRTEGVTDDGGNYRVCVVDSPWLVGSRDQVNLRFGTATPPAFLNAYGRLQSGSMVAPVGLRKSKLAEPS